MKASRLLFIIGLLFSTTLHAGLFWSLTRQPKNTSNRPPIEIYSIGKRAGIKKTTEKKAPKVKKTKTVTVAAKNPGSPAPSPSAAPEAPETPEADDSLGDFGDGDAYGLNQVDVAPVLIPNDDYELKYPSRARNANIVGFVTLEWIVDENGKVTSITVIKESPENVGFAKSGSVLVGTYRFKPAVFNGRAVKVRVQQTFRFDLND